MKIPMNGYRPFLKKLTEIAKTKKFFLDGELIRVGKHKSGQPEVWMCPLTVFGGKSSTNYREAGKDLGLDYKLISAIALAADEAEDLDPFEKKVRKDLLKACGLETVPATSRE